MVHMPYLAREPLPMDESLPEHLAHLICVNTKPCQCLRLIEYNSTHSASGIAQHRYHHTAYRREAWKIPFPSKPLHSRPPTPSPHVTFLLPIHENQIIFGDIRGPKPAARTLFPTPFSIRLQNPKMNTPNRPIARTRTK